MFKLPITDNTVVEVEQAIVDQYSEDLSDKDFWNMYTGSPYPSRVEKCRLLEALNRYQDREW